MRPLGAAKRMTAAIAEHCDFCTGSPTSGHFGGCPMLAMTRIVAALEAAQEWADGFPGNSRREEKLRAALKGDEA